MFQFNRAPRTAALREKGAKLERDLHATTHAVFGVAALAGAALVTGSEPPFHAYPVAVAAAWLPDVDNPRSKLGNGLSRTGNPAISLLTRPVSGALRLASFSLIRTFGHRTLTHSLLSVGILYLGAWMLLGGDSSLPLALVAGYASHLFADALNPRGVPLFWPLDRCFRIVPLGIRAGGPAELAVALGALGVAAYELSLLHPVIRTVLSLQPL